MPFTGDWWRTGSGLEILAIGLRDAIANRNKPLWHWLSWVEKEAGCRCVSFELRYLGVQWNLEHIGCGNCLRYWEFACVHCWNSRNFEIQQYGLDNMDTLVFFSIHDTWFPSCHSAQVTRFHTLVMSTLASGLTEWPTSSLMSRCNILAVWFAWKPYTDFQCFLRRLWDLFRSSWTEKKSNKDILRLGNCKNDDDQTSCTICKGTQ